jgi:hypothetical protein
MWKNVSKQREFLNGVVAKELGVSQYSDWYKITTKQVRQHGGSGILKEYGNSLRKVLTSVFPEYQWDFSHNKRLAGGYWSNLTNQRDFMDKAFCQLQLTSLDDWYRVTIRDIEQCGGHGLLNHHNHSLVKALQAIYPHHNWDITKFNKTRNNYWHDIRNQRHFLDNLAKRLSVSSPQDWYRYTVKDIQKNGGSSLLKLYKNSLITMLSKVYPDVQWEAWKFRQVPSGFWDQEHNTKSFVESLSKQLGIIIPQDWANVTHRQLQSLRTGSLLHKVGSLGSFLSKYAHFQPSTQKATYLYNTF